MKKLLLSAIAVCITLASGAASYNMLNVHLTDGSKVDVLLTSDLTLAFTDTDLVATGADQKVTVTVPRESISKFVHTYDPGAGIDEVTGGSMAFNGNTLSFDSLPAGSVIKFYTLAGVAVRTITAEGAVELSLDDLATGAYIVTVNNVSYKITIK